MKKSTHVSWFLALILFQAFTFENAMATEIIANCFSAEHMLNDEILREKINQPCVKEWAQAETKKTVEMLTPGNLLGELKKFLPTLSPSNPPSTFETNLGELSLVGGSLQLRHNGQTTLLVDRTKLPADTVVNDFKLSPDGKKLIYSLVISGSDVAQWHFYDLENLMPLNDSPIRLRLFYISWSHDSQGVYYSQWPSREVEDRWIREKALRRIPVAYHALGQASDTDKIIFESPEKIPSMLFGVEKSSTNNVYMAFRFFPTIQPLPLYRGTMVNGTIQWSNIISAGAVPLVRSRYLGRINNDLMFLSSHCGTELCITKMGIENDTQMSVVVQRRRGHVITEAQMIGDKIFVQYLDKQFNVSLKTFDSSGNMLADFSPSQIGLPNIGKIFPVVGTHQSKNVYFTFSAVNSYPSTLKFNLDSLHVEALDNLKPAPEILNSITTEVKYYRSLDGTRVPIQVFKRADLVGPAKFALVYYYGAITISTLSSYSPRFLSVLKMGGIVAIANIRGGGELGELWSREGNMDKQKTVQDIAAASRWLKKNYTIEGQKTIAEGGSWGGVHTYLTAIHYPDDFTAFVSLVPVANRTYAYNGLFGWLLPDDVLFARNAQGDYSDFEKSMEQTRQWSPFQNVVNMKNIKPMLSIGAANDERTGSEQNYMMSLAIKHHFGQTSPVYLIETGGGGHGGSTSALAEELTFMGQQTGVETLR